MSHAVTIRLIRTDPDLAAALARLDAIFHAVPDAPEGDEREALATLVHDCECRVPPVERPSDRPLTPVEAIRFHVERLELDEEDPAPYLGGASCASEVLAGRRKLDVEGIARLSRGLGVPAEDLLGVSAGT